MKISASYSTTMSGTICLFTVGQTLPYESAVAIFNWTFSGTVGLCYPSIYYSNGLEADSADGGVIIPEPDLLYKFLPSQIAISAYMETPWIHLPRAIGMQNWSRTRTEGLWIKIYAGGEDANSSGYITLSTEVMFNLDRDTVVATYSTTHNAAAYPALTCEPRILQSAAGDYGPFEWIKLRISNNGLEKFNLFKVTFGFAVKPMVEGA